MAVSSPLYLQLKIFLTAKSLLSCAVFVTSSSPSCPLSVILQPPVCKANQFITGQRRHHFVCFRDSPSKSCAPNERGCLVLDGPWRLKGARSLVPNPTWGSNYPSDGPLRAALQADQRTSHTMDFHFAPKAQPPSLRRPLKLDVTWPGRGWSKRVGSAGLGLGSWYWRKNQTSSAKLSRGERQMGRWKRRGFDRKRNGLSGRDK